MFQTGLMRSQNGLPAQTLIEEEEIERFCRERGGGDLT